MMPGLSPQHVHGTRTALHSLDRPRLLFTPLCGQNRTLLSVVEFLCLFSPLKLRRQPLFLNRCDSPAEEAGGRGAFGYANGHQILHDLTMEQKPHSSHHQGGLR